MEEGLASRKETLRKLKEMNKNYDALRKERAAEMEQREVAASVYSSLRSSASRRVSYQRVPFETRICEKCVDGTLPLPSPMLDVDWCNIGTLREDVTLKSGAVLRQGTQMGELLGTAEERFYLRCANCAYWTKDEDGVS